MTNGGQRRRGNVPGERVRSGLWSPRVNARHRGRKHGGFQRAKIRRKPQTRHSPFHVHGRSRVATVTSLTVSSFFYPFSPPRTVQPMCSRNRRNRATAVKTYCSKSVRFLFPLPSRAPIPSGEQRKRRRHARNIHFVTRHAVHRRYDTFYIRLLKGVLTPPVSVRSSHGQVTRSGPLDSRSADARSRP